MALRLNTSLEKLEFVLFIYLFIYLYRFVSFYLFSKTFNPHFIFTNLKHSLGYTKIGSEGADALARSFEENKTLQELDLAELAINEHALVKLATAAASRLAADKSRPLRIRVSTALRRKFEVLLDKALLIRRLELIPHERFRLFLCGYGGGCVMRSLILFFIFFKNMLLVFILLDDRLFFLSF